MSVWPFSLSHKVAGSKKKQEKAGVGEILGFHPKNPGPSKSLKFRSINLSSADLQLKLMDQNFDDFGGANASKLRLMDLT